MSKCLIRIQLESMTMFRHLALFLPGGLTWLRFSTCTFLRHLAFWNRTKALRAFRLFLSFLLGAWFFWPVSLVLHVLFDACIAWPRHGGLPHIRSSWV